ncbi:hypothetical protein ACEWY4_015066 [Coilia grayii]|uniref:Protein crumbs homolog 1 n=1 Tax=Coilia grayii TaxID=363190 RepID=A0ABD1JUD7_9TELE
MTYLSLGVCPLPGGSVCLTQPCQNGGSCQEAAWEYSCQCAAPAPSTLTHGCQQEHQPCPPRACQGNTTCHPKSVGARELSCRCEAGGVGRPCQSRVQLCAQELCGMEEGIQCRLSSTLHSPEGEFGCVCPPGFTGPRCETAVDHCTPNPCRNRAICRRGMHGPACFCVPGFQGALCEVEVDECVSQPCRNGATCLNKIGRFLCLCRAGFTGVSCELQIDECQSQPCLNGGRCHDYVDGFSCTCAAGFQGDRCEVDVDECGEQSCQHGAHCIDAINGFSCDCSDTGFMGLLCDVAVPPCLSSPCLNAALCEETGTGYTCRCWPGFEGPRCEVDVNECASSPCLNGGHCLELSWEHLYGSEPDLPMTYDPRLASGYMCRCPPAFKGGFCQEDVNECEASPCENGGVCENTLGSYRCVCPRPAPDGLLYGGQNCTEPLRGCAGHECQNEAACAPFLSEGRHGYDCLCPAGFTGSRCQTATTFSFERRGHLLLQTPLLDAEATSNITLSFRTVLPHAVLFQRGSGGPLLSLEVWGGRLRLSLHGAPHQEPLGALELPRWVADGQWHTVQALLSEGLLELAMLGEPCDGGGPECEGVAQVDSGPLGAALQHTLIGAAVEGGAGGGAWGGTPAFIGCLRDLLVDSQLMVPEDWLSSSAVNITPGCSHRDRCQGAPCENRGQCVNLWQAYRCHCQRPHEGQNCSQEYITARFGHEEAQSYAIFSLEQDREEWDALSVSVFVRTRRPAGLLLALSNGTGQYLRVWLERGRVHARAHQLEEVRGTSALDDGEVHLLTVSAWGGRLRLLHAGLAEGGVAVETRPMRVQGGDRVHVGGLEDPRGTEASGGYFKGCLQDLRLGGVPLQFFPLQMEEAPPSLLPQNMNSVIQGCDGDDACMKSPCQNGGVCFSTWDDFSCMCPPNTAGQRCEDVRWCELSPCPPDAECRPLAHGYECIGDMTFQGNTTMLYRGSGRIASSLASIAFSLRTSQSNAAILHAERGQEFVTVWLQDGFLVLQLQSSEASSPLPSSPSTSTSSPSSPEPSSPSTSTSSPSSPEPSSPSTSTSSPSSPEPSAPSTSTSSPEPSLQSTSPSAPSSPSTSLFAPSSPSTSSSVPSSLSTSPSTPSLPELSSPSTSPSAPSSPSTSPSGPSVAASATLTLRSSVPVNDGAWHSAEFLMTEPWAEASAWTLLLDGREELSSTSGGAEAGSLGFLRRGVEVQLGGLGPEAGGWGLVGCLGTVELGGVALPFYAPHQVALRRAQDERFDLTGLTGAAPTPGCRGDAVCRPDTCLSGGRCRDLSDGYACECPPGWVGRRCELHEDTCASAPCVHGNCSVVGLGYACECQLGYSGPQCDTEVDVCEEHQCANGATCLHGINMYACLCSENYTGSYCRNKIEELPWYIDVTKERRPKLPVSICGDEQRNYTCFNGANCSLQFLTCDCTTGFTGHRCEQEVDECKSNPCHCCNLVNRCEQEVDECKSNPCLNGGYCRNLVNRCEQEVDECKSNPCHCCNLVNRCEQEVDECKSNPCLNGGYCRNLVNRFQCVCELSFGGERCEIDVSDIYFYVALLLWQNLFQLLSYLILRLDDDQEPQIEWG